MRHFLCENVRLTSKALCVIHFGSLHRYDNLMEKSPFVTCYPHSTGDSRPSYTETQLGKQDEDFSHP